MNNNLLTGMLKCINPKMNISNSHYICGSNLAIFASLSQIENCLTGITSKCKLLSSSCCNRKGKNNS